MSTDKPNSVTATVTTDDTQARRVLSPEAQRALAEAEVRRQARRDTDTDPAANPTELGGRAGPDPVRYGDWENGGIASDF